MEERWSRKIVLGWTSTKVQPGSRIPSVLVAVCLLTAWQVAAMAADIPAIFPSPVQIVIRMWQLREMLFLHHLPATLATILLGWVLSVLIGAVLAIFMHKNRIFRTMLHPVLVVTQTIPVMCISPLFVLWFGYTIWARLLAVVLSTFYSITLNTYDGLQSASRERRELLRTYGAGGGAIFFRLEVPSALPHFLTGLKMTFPWAVVDAAAAEWLGANSGLGYISRRMISAMDGAGVFAPILILCILALLGMLLLNILERKFTWYAGTV